MSATGKTPQEIELLCQAPGPTGVIWRLTRAWNPDGLGPWMKAEQERGTPPEDAATAIANMLAAIAWGFACQTTNVMPAIEEIEKIFAIAVGIKKQRHQPNPGGILIPSAGDIVRGGA
jgi:hypothetical protein